MSTWSIADDSTTRRNVKVGHEDAQASIITDGLKPGEKVVIDGASRLTDGSKVTIVQPAGRRRRRRRNRAPGPAAAGGAGDGPARRNGGSQPEF